MTIGSLIIIRADSNGVPIGESDVNLYLSLCASRRGRRKHVHYKYLPYISPSGRFRTTLVGETSGYETYFEVYSSVTHL